MCLHCLSSDPLPPANLQVKRDSTKTDSVTVTWESQSTMSYSKKWMVQYTVKTKYDMKHINTSSANTEGQVIDGLVAGETYTISVYGVTYDGIVSLLPVQVDATVS